MPHALAAVFIGSDTLLLQCVEHWRSLGHTVTAVVTDTDKVRRFCAEQGLRCLDAAADYVAEFANQRPDYLFAVTWLRLLPERAIGLPTRLAVNFHDGPLPRYAGLNATCWAILQGEREHGVTWHTIEASADTGAILVQRLFAIEPDDTAFTLNARCFQHAQESFAELCERIGSDTLAPRVQDRTQRSWFGRHQRPRHLGVVDCTQSAAAVGALVRGLDHGGYKNPLAIAKLVAPHGVFVPGEVAVVGGGGKAPGTVLAVADDELTVAVADGELRFSRCRCLRGTPMTSELFARYGVVAGAVLPRLAAAQLEQLDQLAAASAPHEERWAALLRGAEPLPVPEGQPAAESAAPAQVAVPLAPLGTARAAAALCAAFLARHSARAEFAVGWQNTETAPLLAATSAFAVVAPPLPLQFDFAAPVAEALAAAERQLAAAPGPLLRDLVVRRSDVLPWNVVLEPAVRIWAGPGAPPVAAGSLTFAVAADGAVVLHFDGHSLPAARATAVAQRLAVFARAAAAQPQQALRQVPILDDAELQRLIHAWNETDTAPAVEPCVHRQFLAQAAATPTAVALVVGDERLDYAQLQRRVDHLAGWLRQRGVGRGDRVGLCTQRGIGMVAAALAAQRCGAAYVPLDPSYPRERLQFMAEDAELRALVTDAGSAAAAPVVACARVDLDADAAAIAAAAPLGDDPATGDDLAYLIYTSGSTGRPKGVMVRHRNVANFFVGMDRVLGVNPAAAGADPRGVWLAVTSLSFDISVLELLWTLCRGFTVVVHSGENAHAQRQKAVAPLQARPITFSLFYFASDEGEFAEDKYRLLTEGARFADQHGFEAIWTPERHFHAFGGLYPNPAVASAAVAAITQNVAIRAGSCVVTLHHPIRVAEDWALVDNLSHGRVGIAFAAGWHARDFVLRPENFVDRKNAMFTAIRQIQALWRGEEQEFPGHDGKLHRIRTLPRPVQKELPTWVTIAGNPETYRQAGEAGAFVLTHLLGQSLEELQHKLTVYRDAWRSAGHAGEGRVTLMLHTFVGDSDDAVREVVRGPMKGYLRSSLDLVKQAAWSFPAFKNRVDKPGELDAMLSGGLTAEDFEALLDFSFERYYRTSGLFGSVDDCVRIVDRLRGLGVDEVACLIDYGVPTDVVLQHLPKLLEVKKRCDLATAAAKASCAAVPAAASRGPATIPELITAHGVTHFQCTPSLAAMLLHDPTALPALRKLRHMLVGGEALPKALAQTLRSAVGALHDVYGPTETTVWSTTARVGDEDPVPIGRPLANQRVYVLDDNRQPVPTGAPGELWIGGAGVTAGYFRRPELTAEKFVADPFFAGQMYATGDLARWRADGVLEYLGRKDHQVKVRGYRIELGEIEAALGQHPGIREAVVVARGDTGEATLVAYYVTRQPAPGAEDLRAHLRGQLPEFMVPSHFVALPDLPRTPNLKVDRKALPAPEAAAAAAKPVVAAEGDAEGRILAIWRRALGTDAVGVEDNFFDSGGHSILAVRVHREIVQELGVQLQVTDLFRFTTVRALARHLDSGKSAPTAAQLAAERAKQRRNLLRR